MSWLRVTITVIFIGAGATAILDLWLMFLQRLGVQTGRFALIGRWVGHLFQGRFAHPSIGKAPPVSRELLLGWITHYITGVSFATLLVAIQGVGWIVKPALLPALAMGLGTVAAPLFVMQPAMGAGFAASRTPAPLQNCLRSLANHTVFGLGLYLSACLLALISG